MKEYIMKVNDNGIVSAVVCEFIRCKDCKYWSDKQILEYRICKKWEKHCKNFATSKDWFCAEGERAE